MKKTLLFLFIFVSIVAAQELEHPELTGSLFIDAQSNFEYNPVLNYSDTKTKFEHPDKKSPFLAGVMSFVVPGSGEVYSGNYLKAAIFMAAEVAAITTAIIYDNKGDDQTAVFENFANQNWSVNQYASWTLKYARRNQIVGADDYNDLINNGVVDWNKLNQLESAIGSTEVGKYYSHRLAANQDQQYFEMIGKYPQFNPGWNDFGEGTPDPTEVPYQYGDPVTEKFKYYSGQRGEANDFYSVAKTAVIITFVNHVLSAADAAWSTSRYNKRLQVKVNLEKANVGYRTELYPVLDMKIRF